MKLMPLLLVGAGGHAGSCIDVIEQDGRFVVAGLVGVSTEVGSQLLGYPVVGTDEDLPALVTRYHHVLIVVGHITTPEPRIRLFEKLQRIGCKMPDIVSPRAYVSRHANLGQGTIIMHGAIVNAGASVAKNCIINSHALVEHDVVIEDHCHVSTGAAINGGVHVGAGTFIGSGSTVRESITLGEGCLIGMGQQVLTDCEAGTRMPDTSLR